MMGPRNRSGGKQGPKGSSSSSQKMGLLPSSSDGLEGSCSSSSHSCGSTSETAYLHSQKSGPKSQVQYVNSDGSIYTLSVNPHQFPRGNSQQQLSYIQPDAILNTGSPNNFSPNCNHVTTNHKVITDLPNVNQQQQQHRRLQYQVHQQLQRIYSNNERRQQPINHVQQEDRKQQFITHRHKQSMETSQQKLGSGLFGTSKSNDSLNQDHQYRSAMMENSREQTYDSLSPPSQARNYPDEAVSAQNVGRQRQAHIGAIPEECNDDNDDVLLLPEPDLRASKRTAIARKNHLEDLHYATVTAAALLSATANAAAAFAATEKSTNRAVESGNQTNAPNTIYSDTYQEIRNVQNPIVRCNQQHQRQRQQIQEAHRNSIYADNVEAAGFRRNPIQGPVASGPMGAVYGPALRRNMNDSQVYNILPATYQSVNFNRPTPPQPPVRRLGRGPINTMNAQMELMRQHQQRLVQQRSQMLHQAMPAAPMPAPIPALAVLHQGGSGASLKADLIGRMLVSNMIAAQRAAATASESQHVQAANMALADRGRTLAEKMMESQDLAHGIQAYRDKHHGIPGQIYSVSAGIAPSNVSGHSNVPLVLDRKLRPLGFIERICRIDLTLFWWSLLIVCFVFMGAITAISRYVFKDHS